jgi:hypothetical protein
VNETAPEREEKMLNPVQLQNLAREKIQTLHKEARARHPLKDKPLRATWKKENNKLRIVWVGSHSSPILVND